MAGQSLHTAAKAVYYQNKGLTESGSFLIIVSQQVKVKCQNGQIQENRYDTEGLRHEIKENEKLLRFVYHRGEDEKSYHLGYGIEAVSGGGEISYYHWDEQLSTALMTGEARCIIC